MIVRTGLTRVTVKHEDAEFCFRELSTKEEADIAVKSTQSPGAGIKDKFVRALVSWTDLQGPDGNDLPCIPDNKRAVFDANTKLVEIVLEKYIIAIAEELESEKKISNDGQDGILVPRA